MIVTPGFAMPPAATIALPDSEGNWKLDLSNPRLTPRPKRRCGSDISCGTCSYRCELLINLRAKVLRLSWREVEDHA